MAEWRRAAYLRTMTQSDDPESRRLTAMRRIEAETGIDEPMIARLVDAFYDRVRADPLIGPVFADRISDWGPHLAQMRLFWSSVALMSGAYHGRPMPKHLPLPVDARHFDRWLELFEATAAEVCPPRRRRPFHRTRPPHRRKPGTGHRRGPWRPAAQGRALYAADRGVDAAGLNCPRRQHS